VSFGKLVQILQAYLYVQLF